MIMDTNEKKMLSAPTLKEQGYIPLRYLTVFISAIGMFLYIFLRINMNFAIIYMVKGINSTNGSVDAVDVCGFNNTFEEDFVNEGEFEWDEWTQGLITGSFYWGYIWSQFPAGRISEKIGGRYVMGASIFLSGIINLLIPPAAYLGKEALITTRVILGFVAGGTFPALNALLSCWAPPQERSLLLTLSYIGCNFASIFTYPLSALIINNLGWEWVFIIPGTIAIFWSILFYNVSSDNPNTHKWISKAERDYINQLLSDIVSEEHPPVPWRALLTSLPFWSIVFANFGDSWGFFTIQTDLPLYMKEMMSEDINSNVVWSSVPYCGTMLVTFSSALLTDKLVQHQVTSRTLVRKTAHFLNESVPAICMFTITFVDCDRDLTKVLFIIAVSFGGFSSGGYLPNTMDIAPNFTGTIVGIENAIGTVSGFLAPMTVGALTTGNQSFEQWHKVFYIATAIYVGNCIFYLIFASGEVQPWNALSKNIQEDAVGLPKKGKRSSIAENNQYKTDIAYAAYVNNPNYRNTFINSAFEDNE